MAQALAKLEVPNHWAADQHQVWVICYRAVKIIRIKNNFFGIFSFYVHSSAEYFILKNDQASPFPVFFFFMQPKAYKPIPAKMTKQTLFESFLKRWKDPVMRQQKTLRLPTKRIKRKYQESSWNYGFFATIDSHVQSLLFVVTGYPTKPWNLQKTHIKTKHPSLKDKPLEFFEWKKCKHKRQKQLLKATTSSKVYIWGGWRVDPACCYGHLSWTFRSSCS